MEHEPLIFNRDLPDYHASRQPLGRLAYDMLRKLEATLRQCIITALSRINPSWWEERIPADVRERAEERRAKLDAQFPWHKDRTMHPIHFVDFADYAKIILRQDNWREAFSSIFKDREVIGGRLHELEPIRNAIAHARPIAPRERTRLALLVEDVKQYCARVP